MLTVPTIVHMPGERPTVSSMASSSDTITPNNAVDTSQMPSMYTPTGTGDDSTGSSPAISTSPTEHEKPNTSNTDDAQYPSTMTDGQTSTTDTQPNESDPTKPAMPTMASAGTASSSSSTTTTTSTTIRDRPAMGTNDGLIHHTDPYFNEVKPPVHPYDGLGKPQDFSYLYPSLHQHDKYPVYQDIYPIYSYRPSFEPPTSISNYLHYDNVDHYAPAISYAPTVDYYGSTMMMTTTAGGTPPMAAHRPSGSSGSGGLSYMGNGWSNADDDHRPKVPGSNVGSPYGEGNSNFHSTDVSVTPTVPYIRTYFNPDDNLMKRKCEYTRLYLYGTCSIGPMSSSCLFQSFARSTFDIPSILGLITHQRTWPTANHSFHLNYIHIFS